MKLLITGGAGFVGSSLARAWKREHPQDEVVVLDNLRRRGSELNLEFLKREGIRFVHGDIRSRADLNELGTTFDSFIEASAEPSVLAGLNSAPDYLLQSNLVGTLHCLDYAKQNCGSLIFLSTSRVYSIAPLRNVALTEATDRFEINPAQSVRGLSARGIAETFDTTLPRSLYGASKLASELFVQEYADTYKLPALVNRCGVIAGPGQFGKVDQGVFTLWVAHHFFKKPLRYTGFGAQGKQVRDLLHPLDLYDLVKAQIAALGAGQKLGEVYNVGGGREISVSLKEMSALCQKSTGHTVEIPGDPSTSPVDIPLYLSDTSKVEAAFGWKPRRGAAQIVDEITAWLRADEKKAREIFG